MRPVAEQVITLTDKACVELLDEEHANLARHVVGCGARLLDLAWTDFPGWDHR